MANLMAWIRGLTKGADEAALLESGVKEMTTEADLDEALAKSKDGAVYIFKHSTTCPISAAAHREVLKYVEEANENTAPFYYVRVIEKRKVSNAIAETLGVRHQSPQILRIDNQAVSWHASHGGITKDTIAQSATTAGGS